MQTNEIRIAINVPVQEVFEYTLDPKNTPQWVPDCIEMHTDTEQIGVGTKYINEHVAREVTDYAQNQFLELSDVDGVYVCSYSFRKIDEGSTELIFFELNEDGSKLEPPMEERFFQNLKKVLEK